MQDSTKDIGPTISIRPDAGRAAQIAADDPACLLQLEQGTRVVVGNAGDHPRILDLLVQAYQSPRAEDFQSRLDEPSYEPCDRLLVERDERLLGHVQVSKHFGWFHGQRCPLVTLEDFVTLPEYRTENVDKSLLKLAESTGVQEGAILAIANTDRPEWFEQQGWSRWRGQGHTRANTRAILSQFDLTTSQQPPRRGKSLEVRTWRHFEIDQLRQLHQQLCTNTWGMLHRSEEAWQWLVGRKAQDQILLAVEKRSRRASLRLPATSDSEVEADPIQDPSHKVIGYAVVRDSCIVEMLTLPGYASARVMLIERACRDAIDRDHHFVSLHTPATDPMHELLVTAGGSWIRDCATSGGHRMFKLLAPDRWIDRFYPVLHERAREAAIQRPLQIDFAVDGDFQRLTLTRRSSRLEPCSQSAAPQAQCDWQTFQNLLMSNLTLPDAQTHGRLQTTHTSTIDTLAAIFPPKLFWQSPFPLLRI